MVRCRRGHWVVGMTTLTPIRLTTGPVVDPTLSDKTPRTAEARWDGNVCLVEWVRGEWQEVEGTRSREECVTW